MFKKNFLTCKLKIKKYDDVIEKASKELGEALLIIVEENQLDDGICGFAEPCIEDLCDASYAKRL